MPFPNKKFLSFEPHQKVVDNHIFENQRELINDRQSHWDNRHLDEQWYIDLYHQYHEDSDSFREPLEFWEVSYDFYKFASKQGELVTIIDDKCIWGRETSGQKIIHDWIIGRYVVCRSIR